MNYEQFAKKVGVKLACERAARNPAMADEKWAKSATHYKCMLSRGKTKMSLPYSMGSAHTKPPDIGMVLNSLASDASGYEQARSFEDWASEYGYDTDSRSAKKTYKAVEKETTALKMLLGDDFETLLYKTREDD